MATHYLVDRRTTASVESGTTHVNPKWENKAVTASSYTTVSKTAISEGTKATSTYTNANQRVMRLGLWDSETTGQNAFEFGNTVKVGFARVTGGVTSANAKTTPIQEYITLTKNGDYYEYYYYVDSETVGSDSFVFILDDTLQEENKKQAATTATVNYTVSTGGRLTVLDTNENPIVNGGEVAQADFPIYVSGSVTTRYKFQSFTVRWFHNGVEIVTNMLENAETGGYQGNFTPDLGTTLTIDLQAVLDTSEYNINYQTSNCDFTATDSTGASMPQTWTQATQPLTFTAKAKEGFYFENLPRVSYYESIGQQTTAYFTLDENTGIYSITIQPYNGAITVYANAAADTSIANKYGVITVYKPTLDDLKAIAAARYFYETGSYSDRYYKDLGEFIAKLHKVYCKVETDRTQKLYLGNYAVKNTNLLPVIDDNTITLDCGNIAINGKYENVVDYNATAKIYLPFMGFRDIDVKEVLDETIHLYYKLDVITGNAKAFLTVVNDENETVIYTWDCVLSYNIPWVLMTNVSGDFELNANYMYGLQSFIMIDYPIITGDNTTYGNYVNKVGLIGTMQGLTAFDEITLVTTATETERNEIIRILESGVIL